MWFIFVIYFVDLCSKQSAVEVASRDIWILYVGCTNMFRSYVMNCYSCMFYICF